MTEELNEVQQEQPVKKTKRVLHKNIYVIVNREDPKDHSLCFDQNELMNNLMNPEWSQKYYPIIIDSEKLYH